MLAFLSLHWLIILSVVISMAALIGWIAIKRVFYGYLLLAAVGFVTFACGATVAVLLVSLGLAFIGIVLRCKYPPDPDRPSKKKPRFHSALFGATMVGTLVMIGFAASATPLISNITGNTSSSKAEARPIDDTTDANTSGSGAADKVTVNSDFMSKAAVCTSDVSTYTPDVKPGNNAYRQFTTAVSTPLTASTSSALLDQVMERNCTDLSALYSTAIGMNATKISGTNATIGSVNPEIPEFIASAKAHGLASFGIKDASGTIHLNAKAQAVAAIENQVLLQLVNDGVHSDAATTNTEVPPGVLTLATFSSQPDTLPALQLSYTTKVGCFIKVGFNLLDDRYETFPCVVSTPPKSSTPPTKTTTVTTTPPTKSTTPPPTKTTTPPPTKTTPPPTKTTPPPTKTCEQIGIAKCAGDSVKPPAGVTKQPVDTLEPTAPKAPTNPINPTTKPGSDTGSSTPVEGATQTGSSTSGSTATTTPVQDTSGTGASTSTSTTPITDPDAG